MTIDQKQTAVHINTMCKTRKTVSNMDLKSSHKGPLLEFMYLLIVSHSPKQLGTGKLVINKSSQNYN